MIEYVSAHWIEWVFAIITTIATLGYRSVVKKLQEEHVRNEAILKGVQSLLRESIVDNYNKYQDKGFCPIYAKESVKKVYQAYHDLGGNDVATSLFHKILDMPEEKEGENE
jgi:hypothetical protein